MRTPISLALALLFSASLVAQTLGSKAAALQHASITGLVSTASVAPGGQVALWADVTPTPGIHIYAAGAKEFSPVALTLIARNGVTPSAPTYPPPGAPLSLKTAVDPAAPAYYSKFRITQPIAIAKSAKPGESIVVEGRVSYQACDDRLCYPVTSEPVSWTITVR